MQKTKNRWIWVFSSLIFIAVSYSLFQLLPAQHTGIKMMFLFMVTPCLIGCIVYLSKNDQKATQKIIESQWLHYCIIAVISIICFFPLLTQAFLYHDDLWCFTGEYTNQITAGIGFARPIWGIIWGWMASVKRANSFVARIISTAILYLFSCFCYKWIREKSGKWGLALLCAIAMNASIVAVDLIGYLSIFPVGMALLFSALSIVSFDYAVQKECHQHHKILLILLSTIAMFSAFNLYQVSTPIVALFLAVIITYSSDMRKSVVYAVKYMVVFGISSLCHLFFVKALRGYYNITLQESRGQFIRTLPQIWHKVHWFILNVIPQTLNRIVSVFTGKRIFKPLSLFYDTSYRSKPLGIILTLFIMLLIIVFFVSLIRKKRFLQIVMLSLLVPFSYYVFLILPDSQYITYYAFPLFSLLMWFTVQGVQVLTQKLRHMIKNKKKPSSTVQYFFSGALCLLIAVHACNYAQAFWVDYNQASYNVVMDSLTEDQLDQVKKIHVYGTPAPIQKEVYSVFLVNVCLKELHRNPSDYEITSSVSPYLKIQLSAEEYEQVQKSVSEEELSYFNKYYDEQLHYLLTSDLNQEEITHLQNIFWKSGLIPKEDEPAIRIDLLFTKLLYEN